MPASNKPQPHPSPQSPSLSQGEEEGGAEPDRAASLAPPVGETGVEAINSLAFAPPRPSLFNSGTEWIGGWGGVVLRRLYARPASAIGTTIFLAFLFVAFAGPLFVPYGVNEQVLADASQAPSFRHLLGADHLGRDVFTRVILGARDILALAGLGTLFAVLSGTGLGLVSGYLGGWFDELLMRAFDSLLAMPALLLALLLLGVIGPSRTSVLVVILIVYTPIVARVVRSVTLAIKSRGFVEAARLQGEKLPALLFHEILPSVLPALAVEAALRFSYAIFLVASLGFLGVGVQPPSPDWGLMVKEARTHVSQTPWALYFPAGAIALVVVGINLMADGLKSVLSHQ